MRALFLALALGGLLTAQEPRVFPLESAVGLRPVNVVVEPAALAGKRGLRMTMAPDVQQRWLSLTPEQRDAAVRSGQNVEQLAVVDGLGFGDGTISVELAGTPDTAAFAGARGFVGIAFRVQADLKTYDALYLRPTNGRADDQVRRNHSAQYIAHPQWPWFRLRAEFPERYESYVDLVPGAWTQVRIDVRGAQAKLFVHGQDQPTLVVNDLKSGTLARGGVALWIDVGTQAHFRNLSVTPAK